MTSEMQVKVPDDALPESAAYDDRIVEAESDIPEPWRSEPYYDLPRVELDRSRNGSIYMTTHVSSAHLARLYRQDMPGPGSSFCLTVDQDLQRGHSPKGAPLIRQSQVIEMEEVLRDGKSQQFGVLMWNVRPESTRWFYIRQRRALRIFEGFATIPDTHHRHRAIALACQNAEKGTGFDTATTFPVMIFTLDWRGEGELFYALNYKGWRVDATRAQYVAAKVGAGGSALLLARRLHEESEVFQGNVEVNRNSLSARQPEMITFGTFADSLRGREAWPDLDDEDVEDVLLFLIRFYRKLAEVRPDEIGKLSLTRRMKARQLTLADSAVMFHGYAQLARRFYDEHETLDRLSVLSAEDPDRGVDDVLSRDNPRWRDAGILTQKLDRQGNLRWNIVNKRQTRETAGFELLKIVGLHESGTE